MLSVILPTAVTYSPDRRQLSSQPPSVILPTAVSYSPERRQLSSKPPSVILPTTVSYSPDRCQLSSQSPSINQKGANDDFYDPPYPLPPYPSHTPFGTLIPKTIVCPFVVLVPDGSHPTGWRENDLTGEPHSRGQGALERRLSQPSPPSAFGPSPIRDRGGRRGALNWINSEAEGMTDWVQRGAVTSLYG